MLTKGYDDDDDDEGQAGEGKRRKTSNTVLYDLFTREGVVKHGDKDGRQYVHCIACFEYCLALATENNSVPGIQALVPTKRIKRDCERHIRNCLHVSPEVKAQFVKAQFESQHQRHHGRQHRRVACLVLVHRVQPPSQLPTYLQPRAFVRRDHAIQTSTTTLQTGLEQKRFYGKLIKARIATFMDHHRRARRTTCFLLAQELNQGGAYCAVRLSVAAAKWYDKADEAWEAVLESWDRDIYSQLSADLRSTPGRNMRYYADGFREPIPEAISRWANCCPRPLVLFIDDLQALANNGNSSGNRLYHSFLAQLLSGFHDRPKNFAYYICLVGESNRLPSHFNIVSESIQLPNFSRPQVEAIMDQMKFDSSHQVEEDAKKVILTLTQGQPWAVNAFGMILTNKMVEHPKMTFTVEHVYAVLALLIERMDPFLRHIVNIASDRIYGPILKNLLATQPTEQASPQHSHASLEYLQEQGILSKDSANGKYFPTCPALYSELIDKAPASF